MKKVFVVLGICAMLVGCGEKSEYIQLAGLVGTHDLRRLNNVQSAGGSMQGSFLLGTGRIQGSFAPLEVLQFSWSPKKNEHIYTSVPMSKVRVIVQDNVAVPRVEFVIDLEKADYNHLVDAVTNPNALLEHDALHLVRLYISKEMLSQELCLPQL